MIDERYDRQERIAGWNQKKLKGATVAVVGSDALANFVAAALAALGVGRIRVFDNKRMQRRGEEFLYFGSQPGSSRVKVLEDMLTKINPLVKVEGLHWKMLHEHSTALFHNERIIIDATNDPVSKEMVLRYGQEAHTPVIVASAGQSTGKMMMVLPGDELLEGHLLREYSGKPQGNIPSTVVAGLLVEELRKEIMPLNERDVPVRMLRYKCPFESPPGAAEDAAEDYSPNKVLVVGDGALGTFVNLNLALMGIGCIVTVDNDRVEETNLSRQILYYDAVGRPKSEAMAEKLRMINPGIQVQGIVGLFDKKFGEHVGKFDLMIDCVDNFRTRALMNEFAARYRVPFISGGTSPNAGQAMTYYPGLTSCLECQLKVSELAEEEEKRREEESRSCIHNPDPSVIITNQVIGGIMAGEVKAALSPEKHKPTNGIIKYSADQTRRLGIMPNTTVCECHEKGRRYKEW